MGDYTENNCGAGIVIFIVVIGALIYLAVTATITLKLAALIIGGGLLGMMLFGCQKSRGSNNSSERNNHIRFP